MTTSVIPPVAALVIAGLFLTVRQVLLVAVVEGPSMEPSFLAGDLLLVLRRPRRRLEPGLVVLVALDGHTVKGSREQLQLKRIAAVGGRPPTKRTDPAPVVPVGSVYLLGDNPDWSRDSRHYGAVRTDVIVGVVIRKLRSIRTGSRRMM